MTHSHLKHDTAAIRLNLGALAGPLVSPPSTVSYDQATLEKLTPWIVTSPPRPTRPPHPTPPQPSLLQHCSDQPFVAFSYRRPAKKTQEPTLLQLTIAPIDVIYSQLCLLSLLDFLNAAWPAAGLDPLKVRASVSLREIVQEKLLGQQQRQMAQRQQQHNMQRTKVRCTHQSHVACHVLDYQKLGLTLHSFVQCGLVAVMAVPLSMSLTASEEADQQYCMAAFDCCPVMPGFNSGPALQYLAITTTGMH